MRHVLILGLLVACGSPGPVESTCTPMTCGDLGAECGAAADGCGGALACGACPDGLACNADGHCDATTSCTHKTCADTGAQCGTASDGCGGTIACGSCFPGDACVDNLCECVPSCGARACGDDGCGGSCGTCGANEACSAQGTCDPTGGHTTPPPAWHCNAAYWDAADGCDCDCGALDPDCALPNQHLLGCQGLSSPTCDVHGLCTGGGACNATPTGAYLTYYMVIQTAPAMTGGTILPGRYEATDIRSYNPPGGVSGYAGGSGYAIEISGSTWNRVTRPVGGYPNVDETLTASTSGSTLTLSRTCPSALTTSFTYTATPTTRKIAKPSGLSVEVTTYTKRW
jgi:hypothetical protein